MDTSSVLDPTIVETDEATRVFAALADPARLRVLSVLADSHRCVCDIQSVAPMAANLLSYHLRTSERRGWSSAHDTAGSSTTASLTTPRCWCAAGVIAAETARRRTFAIISHPDAGKTTLTEEFLLYAGAVAEAGAVKARAGRRRRRRTGWPWSSSEGSRSPLPCCSSPTATTC